MASNMTATPGPHPTTASLLTHFPTLLEDSFGTVTSWKTAAISLGLGYLMLVQLLRFQREKSMRKRYGYPDRSSLARMTVEDAQKIVKELATLEFPMMSETSLQFALFKTYGVETISKLLLATRNLTDPVKSLRRYEDTAVVIGEFMLNPPNSVRAMTSIARMNWLHSKHIAAGRISNEDLLYTLSVFITEPERFIRLFEWRSYNEMEFCAYGTFWKSIGDAMGIEYNGFLSKSEWVDGLDFARDIAQWAKSYEVTAFIPSETANKPAVALIPMLAYWVPWWARSFVYECVHVLLGDRVREAFLLPEPGITAATVVYSSLFLRRFALRHLCLPRVIPLERHDQATDSVDEPLQIKWPYGNYPFYMKPTVWNRWGPGALAIWLYGGKVPGDQPDVYMPQGYKFENLGPINLMGKGVEEMKQDYERMKAKGMGGCPFS